MFFFLSLACLSSQPRTSVDLDSISPYEQDQTENYNQQNALTITSGDSCSTPCVFEVDAPERTAFVEYFADTYYIGQGRSEGDFSLTYDFLESGMRKIEAVAFDERGNRLADDIKMVEVLENDFIDLTSSTECTNPCSFSARGSQNVVTVEYIVDGWTIGVSDEITEGFAISYTFNELGTRELEVIGYDRDGAIVDSLVETIKIESSNPNIDVPYFYQYSNYYYPGQSCQNTSIAMVLAHVGWSGHPDDITEVWGKDYAQTPQGLANVFNETAYASGISERLTPVTNGTLSELRAELDAGRPTIVHGYFTAYGHVLVVTGYDESGYYVNDPAGKWSQYFQGGYPYGWSTTVGDGIYYNKASFEAAIATWDGYTPAPVWMHKIR